MNIKLTSGMTTDEAVKALNKYEPLRDCEALGVLLGMEWRKPSLRKRLAYLINPPPELILLFDDEEKVP